MTLPPELKEAGSFRLSPDGRLLGYYQHENDEGFLYLVTFPEFGNRTLITHSQSFAWTWHPNGTELLYIDGPTRAMMSVLVKRSGTIEVGPPVKLFEVPASSFYNYTDPRGFSLSSDGKRFLMQQEIRNDADKNGPRPNTVMLVENWFEEYREKK